MAKTFYGACEYYQMKDARGRRSRPVVTYFRGSKQLLASSMGVNVSGREKWQTECKSNKGVCPEVGVGLRWEIGCAFVWARYSVISNAEFERLSISVGHRQICESVAVRRVWARAKERFPQFERHGTVSINEITLMRRAVSGQLFCFMWKMFGHLQ